KHPQPSISVNPSNVVAVGENIRISCKKEENLKGTCIFYLNKGISTVGSSSNTNQNEVEFPIFNAQQSHQGEYTCIYYLNLSPSISIIPNGVIVLGKKVTIQCKQEDNRHVLFNFFKKGALDAPAHQAASYKMAEFLIPSAQESDGGIYFCDYQFYYRNNDDNRYSKFSNKTYINIMDPRVTKPAIFMEPKGQQMLDTDVRIYCQGPNDNLNFSLYKSTDLIASQRTKSNSSLAEFSISGVRLEDIGNYSCCYQLKNKPFMYSQLSDPLQLQVRDPNLTKPSIQIINAEQDAPEATVSIQCKATETDLIFVLLKSGEQIDCKAAEPGEKAVNFSHWMNLEEVQNYTCQYKTRPFVWSVPSDPVDRPPKGSVAIESDVPAKMQYLNFPMEETPDEVSYAAINHNSLKTTLYDRAESCIYANVSKESTKEIQ
ncbi:hypothetical protein E2320_003137, partial [Naja naja]